MLLDGDPLFSGLSTNPDVANFYSTLRAEGDVGEFVYLLFRAVPHTRMSKEELAKACFYVGQTSKLCKRYDLYYEKLHIPRHQLNKRDVIYESECS